ncbi:MAG: hypothetical protein WC378_00060 [Opitutaceae bacterium]|jgi:hypothetical protein
MENIKVVLVHKDAPEVMRRLATRVIDGSKLRSMGRENRFAEAREIYNRMMGISSTIHPYEITETDEPPYEQPALPESALEKFIETQEMRATKRLADALADGLARVLQPVPPSPPSAPQPAEPEEPVADPEPPVEVEPPKVRGAVAGPGTRTMRSPKPRARAKSQRERL